jgi:peptidoglycan/LPS O-acetylase OafA/YrhL
MTSNIQIIDPKKKKRNFHLRILAHTSFTLSASGLGAGRCNMSVHSSGFSHARSHTVRALSHMPLSQLQRSAPIEKKRPRGLVFLPCAISKPVSLQGLRPAVSLPSSHNMSLTATVIPGEGVDKSSSLNLSGRIPELDGLRGIAIGMVLFCHYFQLSLVGRHGTLLAYLNGVTSLTWSGVDLFFVLSGFLIGGILLDARNSVNYFQVFYTRRFFRIMPIYAVILLAVPAFLWLTRSTGNNFSWLFGDLRPWFSYATFTQNFWMVQAASQGGNWLAPTWSLAVEEQFYLTLPLLVRFLPGRRLIVFLLLGICAAPVVRIGLMLHSWENVMAELTLPPCRGDALLTGVLVAVIVRNTKWRALVAEHPRHLRVLFVVLLGGVVFLTRFAPGISFPLMRSAGFTWLALFYATTLMLSVTQSGGWLNSLLCKAWLRWLGSIAYGVYLIHQPVQGLLFGCWMGRSPEIRGLQGMLLAMISVVGQNWPSHDL